MKITVFTQDERVYLPLAIAPVVEAIPDRVAAIVLSPPMSTHGGLAKGLRRHLPVFGVRGTVQMAGHVLLTKVAPAFGIPRAQGQYWSIEEIGRRFGIPTYYVDKVNSDEAARLLDRHPADLLVSVSCPQIIRPAILAKFGRGGINVHSAPLPRYRGLMPTFWLLYHGETESAVSVHVLADKLDNGDILLQRRIPIEANDTWDSLIRKTKFAAGGALLDAIAGLESDSLKPVPNLDSESTYFSFPTADEARAFRAAGKRMF